MSLSAADFAKFYSDVHPSPHGPFPWLVDLAGKVCEQGWRSIGAIDVPTGLGKTSTIDVAVFALAVDAHRHEHEPAMRRAPRRTIFVIDRRLVIDDVFNHARKLADALAKPPSPEVEAVASALRSLAGVGDEEPPLEVVRMRGGITWSWRWLRSPDQPAVIVTTVDQFGSRFLFRGYGVGRHLRSIDAGLVGNDALVIVDEAHLARPLVETVRDACAFQRLAEVQPVPRSVHLVISSATVRSGSTGHVQRISDADWRHPEAGRRLRARKRATLIQVAPTGTGATSAAKGGAATKGTTALADVLCEAALALEELDPPSVVGIVCNTVATARAVKRRLEKRLKDLKRSDVAVDLLIGRIREIDRPAVLQDALPAIGLNRGRPPSQSRFVVATQTIEVGVNVDFDALVTEAAPLDALIQRFGRLDRLGQRGESRAVIVYSADRHRDDPVYGEATSRTWDWLAVRCVPTGVAPPNEAPEVDLAGDTFDLGSANVRAIGDTFPEDRPLWESLLATADSAPVLLQSAHLDDWCRTCPQPTPEAPVEPFLHGLSGGVPEVSIAWRADLDPERTDRWVEQVSAAPVRAWETVTVPIWEARDWLAGKPGPEGPDVEGLSPEQASEPSATRSGDQRPFLRWGDDRTVVTDPYGLRPGDLIVCPAAYGGLDRYGWNPHSDNPVVDVGDLSGARGRPRIRLSVGALTSVLGERAGPEVEQLVSALLDLASEGELTDRDVKGALERLRELCGGSPDYYSQHLVRTLDELLAGPIRHTVSKDDRCIVVSQKGPRAQVDAATDDDEDSSSVGFAQVTLADHSAHVAQRATAIANRLGMPEDIVRAVELAAEAHDLGKADSRFQVMLHRGDRLAALAADQPLAKSGMDPGDRKARLRARERSGLPSGFRHEALSAALVRQYLSGDGGVGASVDRDLIVHLVASHHGRSRPLMPPLTDPTPRAVTVDFRGRQLQERSDNALCDWEAPARFFRLNRRYGPWGLALLEAVLRLADIACSEEGG